MPSDHWYMAVVVLCQDFSIHCPCITDQSRIFAGACLPCQGGPELGQILINVDFGVVVFVFVDILQIRPGTEHTLPDITGRKFNYNLSVLAFSLPAYTVWNGNVSGLQWRVNLDQLTHAQDCCISVVMLIRFWDAADPEAETTSFSWQAIECTYIAKWLYCTFSVI